MVDFLSALGLAIVIEGALYALFPDAMKGFMKQILEQPNQSIRLAGVLAGIFGIIIIWFLRS
ncbi:MAG: hypothetical protein CMM67_05245 [Rhodospirillaceae bacterium]|nr:hypothetical protein [Rhodospirillaceae bacterium]OUT79091.1 MAG: hypothetical protein CBB83_05430 [Rhodospirillaceae bacterium TMED23]|tara:strand:+ start:1572 stop:1757 length:186 start_codon:yes stop_codon:yes gene_type:complete